MLLIYTPKITNRIKYTFDLIFSSILNVDYTIIDNKNAYIEYNNVKLNYSNRPIVENEVYIYAHDILFDNVIKYYHEEFIGEGEEATIFKNKSKADLNFDVFGASFILVSRYEEYLPSRKDKLSRFKPENSFAFKNNFLHKPLVNIWALKLAEVIKEKFNDFEYKKNTYKYIPTFDIDNAYAYKNKGFARTFSSLTNELLAFRFNKIQKRIKVINGIEKDPYDTYELLNRWQNKYHLNPIYFFLLGDYSKYDKNIPFKNLEFRKLIKSISEKAEIGIHPSYLSNKNSKKIRVEKERAEDIIEKTITKSRQHYIKLTFPDTYNNLIENGIEEDYSMGYASKIGFRASICTPFYFYNLSEDRVTKLLIHPFAIMDTTLKHYLKLKPEHALENCLTIINEIKKMGGELITIFHNDSLSQLNGWKKWDEALEKIIIESIK